MAEPGWYPDPSDSTKARWHDGTALTEHTVNIAEHEGPPPPPAGEPAFQPFVPEVPAVAAVEEPLPSGPPLAPPPVLPGPSVESLARRRVRRRSRRFKRARASLVVGLVVAAVVVAIVLATGGAKRATDASSTGASTSTSTSRVAPPTTGTAGTTPLAEHPAPDDVTVTSCAHFDFGRVRVGVTIANHSTTTSSYLVSFDVADGSGTKVGAGNASTQNLAAGKTAKVDGFGTSSSSATGKVTCTVTKVVRYSSS